MDTVTLSAAEPATTDERQWILVELAGEPVTTVAEPRGGREPHLRFTEGGARVTGGTGCNTFNGPVERDGDRIRMGNLAMTRAACVDEPANRQESSFMQALQATERMEQQDDTLSLHSGDRRVAMFIAAP